MAALVWVCSPHNPAGSVMGLDDLAAFRRRAAASGVLMCSDECYADLYDGDPPHSVLETGGTDGVLTYLSLSKRSGMTGYRSGAIVGDRRAIATLRQLRTGTGTAPQEFIQQAAVAAWDDDEHVAVRRSIFREKRALVSKAFADVGCPTVASEAGLYVWVRVDDDVEVANRLLEHGVVVAPGRAFGAGGEGYLRLALVPTIEQCKAAAEVVMECLGKR